MQFLQVVCLLLPFAAVHAQCPWENGSLPSVPNGYRSNVDNLKLYRDGLAFGYYDVDCKPGYTLDTTIGSRITCFQSGSWSQPLPVCKSMGLCSIPELFDYLKQAPGLRTVPDTNFIYRTEDRLDDALGGSNITVRCTRRYKNTGGPLLIVCTDANKWTPFPSCVPTVARPPPPARCSFNQNMLTFENGYLSNTTDFLVYNNDSATGAVTVGCQWGYAVDSTSDGVFACNNGVWSSRPFCTKTPRCSLSTLHGFTNDTSVAQGTDIANQNVLLINSNSDDVLIGSYVEFVCRENYTNFDGNLNVTCNSDGAWSTFPSCNPVGTTVSADAPASAVPADGNNSQ